MKKIITCILGLFICLSISASDFIYWPWTQEYVSIFGVDFYAKQVIGTNKFSGSGTGKMRTPLHDDWVKPMEDFMDDMGAFDDGGGTPIDLFNLSGQADSSMLLDKIDMDYYRNKGIKRILQRESTLEKTIPYNNVLHILNNNKLTPSQQKKLIFGDTGLAHIASALLWSRLDTTQNVFTVSQDVQTKVIASLTAKLDTIVSHNIPGSGSASIIAYINNLTTSSVKIKGVYYDAYYDNDYLSNIPFYINNISNNNLGNDKFAYELQKYIHDKVTNSKSTMVYTEMVAIQCAGSYDNNTISASSISSALTANFNVPSDVALKVSASVSLTISQTINKDVSSSFHQIHIVRYFSSDQLDNLTIGNEKETIQSLKTNVKF